MRKIRVFRAEILGLIDWAAPVQRGQDGKEFLVILHEFKIFRDKHDLQFAIMAPGR